MEMLQKKKRSPGRPAAFGCKDALDNAVNAFWKHGYDGTDVEQIAVSLGATKPSLYRQFGSKKQLFIEAMKHYAARTLDAPYDVLDKSPTVREALLNLFTFAFNSYTRPNEPQGCFLACIATAMAEDHQEAGNIFLEATNNLGRNIASRLERAVKEGELPQNFPVQKRAQLMADLMNAYSLRARAGESRESLMSNVNDLVDHVLN